MAAKAVERPVERAQEPGHAVLIGRACRASPLVRRVEEPNAGETERLGNPGNLREIRRTRACKPAPRDQIKRRHQRQGGAGKESKTSVAECTRRFRVALGMTDGAAIAQIDHWN